MTTAANLNFWYLPVPHLETVVYFYPCFEFYSPANAVSNITPLASEWTTAIDH